MANWLAPQGAHGLGSLQGQWVAGGFTEIIIIETKDKKKNPSIEIVLMDIMMPGESGPEIVKAMQVDPVLKSVPVVFLTGLVTGSERSVQDV